MIRSDIAFLPDRAQMGEMSRALIEPESIQTHPFRRARRGSVDLMRREWLAGVRDPGITILFTHLHVQGKINTGRKLLLRLA